MKNYLNKIINITKNALDKIKDKYKKIKEKVSDTKVYKKSSEKYGKLKTILSKIYNEYILFLYITLSFVVTLIIEMLARNSFWEGIFYLIGSPYIFICNAVIIFMTFSFSLIMKRRLFYITFFSFIWIVAGVANSILLSNRVTPLTGTDLFLIDSALDIVNKYFTEDQIQNTIIIFILVVIALIVFFFKAPKINHSIKYVKNIIAIGLIWVIGFGALNLGLASGLIPPTFGNLRDSYQDYGFVYCFSNSLLNTGVSKPDEYSGESIKAITEESDKTEKVKKKPNIIFVQLESFFDLNKMEGLTFSQDPTPIFNKLKEDYPSGYFNVPIIGAGTVNTEFEVMTGMNLDDFGPGEYPFKTILLETTCESICYNLAEYGYTSHAIHNNTATFYGRNEVYANLGYSTFVTKENMYIEEYTPFDWAKDKYITDEVVQLLESTKKQDFVYVVSVQGHGSYPTTDEYDSPITIEGLDSKERTNQFEYYAGQINEMDQFVGELISEVDKIDEDTIIVFYGDHLPSLGITSSELTNKDIYQTEYVIWSNFDAGYTDEDIESYQLESKILKELNMTEGVINNYSQLHRNDEDQASYLEGLHSLEYDMLYGDYYAYNGINPYEPTDMKLGLRDVIIKSIVPLNNEKNEVYVYGENFTKYSRVYINGVKFSTKYIDRNTLCIRYKDIKNGDKFRVYQQNSDKNILNKSKKLKYKEEKGMKKKNKKNN